MIKKSAACILNGVTNITVSSNDSGVTSGTPAFDQDIILVQNISSQETIVDFSYGTDHNGVSNGADAKIWVYIANLALPRIDADRIHTKTLSGFTAYSSWVSLGKLVIPALYSLVVRFQSSNAAVSGKVFLLAQGYQNNVSDPVI